MAELFEKYHIGTLAPANRFVRSATWEGLAAEDGGVTQELTDCMAELARGRVGLIISGHAYVSPDGQAGNRQLAVYSDENIPGLAAMCDAVHAEDGLIIAQLAHAGGRSATHLTGMEALGPSAGTKGAEQAREMTHQDIAERVKAFVDAAVRAKRAGFDGVQLHCAHGYGFSQFLSPYYNHRTDEYGGSLENRARIVRETLCAVREAVGPDYPVLAKINSEDFVSGGMTLEEMLTVVQWLEADSLDAVELSGGTPDSGSKNPIRMGIMRHKTQEAWYRKAARLAKERLSIPVILVGGIRSYEVAEELVADGIADAIALSRPFIREPHLVRRWEAGDRTPAACLNDNLCFKPASAGQGIHCVVAQRLAEKRKAEEASGTEQDV